MKVIRTILIACTLLMLALTSGCDDPATPCPCVAAGRIQGHVVSPGNLDGASVRAVQVVDGVATDTNFKVNLGVRGSYILDLPAGRYILQCMPTTSERFVYDYTSTGLSYGHIPPDTLLVNDSVSPLEAEFELGGLNLLFEVSPGLNGEQAEVILHRRDAVETGQWRTYLNMGMTTIEDGRAEITLDGLLPGEYKLEIVLGRRLYLCNCPYDGEHFWMPGIRDEAQSPWYEIVADSTLALACTVATEPARIEGRISGAWQDLGFSTPPALSIVDPDSVTIMGLRQVFDDGQFAVDVHLPGPAKLLVSHGGIKQWIGGPGFEEATIFDLQLGQTISDITLVQSGMQLTIEGGGQNYFDSEIRFHDPLDMRLLATARPSLNGESAAIANLWPGDFLMYITPGLYDLGHSPWRPQWYDRVVDPDQAQLVSISAHGEVVHLDLNLEAGGRVAGTLDFGASESTYHHVVITPADEPTVWGSYYAFMGRPNFLVQGLPEGEFRIGAFPVSLGWTRGTPPPASTVWYPGTTDWNSGETITIQNASEVSGIVIPMN